MIRTFFSSASSNIYRKKEISCWTGHNTRQEAWDVHQLQILHLYSKVIVAEFFNPLKPQLLATVEFYPH